MRFYWYWSSFYSCFWSGSGFSDVILILFSLGFLSRSFLVWVSFQGKHEDPRCLLADNSKRWEENLLIAAAEEDVGRVCNRRDCAVGLRRAWILL